MEKKSWEEDAFRATPWMAGAHPGRDECGGLVRPCSLGWLGALIRLERQGRLRPVIALTH